jgi:hypothetical protein
VIGTMAATLLLSDPRLADKIAAASAELAGCDRAIRPCVLNLSQFHAQTSKCKKGQYWWWKMTP